MLHCLMSSWKAIAQRVWQVWLQEFAWTEEEKQEKFLKRAADGEVGEQLSNEPMFCFGEPSSPLLCNVKC